MISATAPGHRASDEVKRTRRWRQLLTPPASGAWNMALDAVLLGRARDTGECVARVYSWKSPTLSLGRNQTAIGRYDLERARELGVEIVRRPTGGRAVLHHREITYSVTAPTGHTDLRDSYGRINEILLLALRSLGADVELAEADGPAPPPNSSPCFEVPTSGEITFRGRKLVGSAQWREDGVLLQHGSILIDDDQPLINQLTLDPIPVPPPAATLRASLGRAPSPEELYQHIGRAVGMLEYPEVTALPLDAEILEAVAIREPHYRSPTWTWRR